MDLLGDVWKERRDPRDSYKNYALKDEGWHAKTMLLGRMSAPLDEREGHTGRYMKQDLEQAFIRDFTEYGDAIFRFCMVKVSNKELAEDMTQEVFTRYWQYLRDGKTMTNTRSLLYTIASNMAKDWYKKKKPASLDAYLEVNQAPAAIGPNPEEDATYQEALRAIEEMEEKDASVLILRFVEGLEPKDIAEILNENANAISVRINRAMTRLKEKLGA